MIWTQKNYTFKLEELKALSELLKVGIPFKEALLLIENERNKKAINKIISTLNEGKRFEEILILYLKPKFYQKLKNFLKILSFEKALSLSLAFDFQQNTHRQKLLKDLLYPSILVFFSLVGLKAFEVYALPMLFELLDNFKVDYSFVIYLSNIIHFFCDAIFILLIVLIILLIYFQKRRRKRLLYKIIKRFKKRSYYELYLNYEFISYYELCLAQGVSTKDTLTLLRGMKKEPLIAYFAYEIDDILNTGMRFEEAILKSSLEKHLYIYMKIAIYSGNLNEMIALYLKENERERQIKLNRMTKRLQLFSYLLIGFFVIFIYQVLFLPMQALSQF